MLAPVVLVCNQLAVDFDLADRHQPAVEAHTEPAEPAAEAEARVQVEAVDTERVVLLPSKKSARLIAEAPAVLSSADDARRYTIDALRQFAKARGIALNKPTSRDRVVVDIAAALP